MCQDWDKLAPNMRKSWGLRESNQLHACCGGFLYFMGLLREKVPTKEYDDVASDLQKQFMMGFLDPDIVHAISTTAPPAPLDSVAFLRKGVCDAVCKVVLAESLLG